MIPSVVGQQHPPPQRINTNEMNNGPLWWTGASNGGGHEGTSQANPDGMVSGPITLSSEGITLTAAAVQFPIRLHRPNLALGRNRRERTERGRSPLTRGGAKRQVNLIKAEPPREPPPESSPHSSSSLSLRDDDDITHLHSAIRCHCLLTFVMPCAKIRMQRMPLSP